MTASRRVSGGMVLYRNATDAYTRTIDSFFSDPAAAQLVVVDNSPDTALLGRLRARYPERFADGSLTYHSLPGNPGYGAAQNHAFRHRTIPAEYHVILNPDVRFEPGTLGALARVMDGDPEVAQIMPRIVDPEGELQYLCKRLPTPADLLARRFIPVASIREGMARRFENRRFGYDRPLNVPYLSGCFMFLRARDFESVGMFDERFFMYPEDIDLTRRLHRGRKTLYHPGATAVHDHERASYKSLRMNLVHLRNMKKYFDKWGWFRDPERRDMNRRLDADIDAMTGRPDGLPEARA